MRCPYCHSDALKVTDSRNAPELNAVRRRRECQDCQQRFTTFETVDVSIEVLKRDGRYENFDLTKLVAGLEAACHRARVSRDQVQMIAADVVKELMRRGVRTVTTRELGELVMGKLQEVDSVAYIRFACVYRRFKDIDQLVQAIETMDEREGAMAPTEA